MQFACEMLPASIWAQVQYHPYAESEVLQLPEQNKKQRKHMLFSTNSPMSIIEAHAEYTYKQIDITL